MNCVLDDTVIYVTFPGCDNGTEIIWKVSLPLCEMGESI